MLFLQTTLQPSNQKNKSNGGPLTCVVCGSSANGYNFGAIVCESCKAFFRRNAFQDSVSTGVCSMTFVSSDRTFSPSAE